MWNTSSWSLKHSQRTVLRDFNALLEKLVGDGHPVFIVVDTIQERLNAGIPDSIHNQDTGQSTTQIVRPKQRGGIRIFVMLLMIGVFLACMLGVWFGGRLATYQHIQQQQQQYLPVPHQLYHRYTEETPCPTSMFS